MSAPVPPEGRKSPAVSSSEPVRLLRFLELSQDAHLVTYDTESRRPLFAHWFGGAIEDERWQPWQESRTRILWAVEPTPELRLQEERIRVRFLLGDIAK